MEDPHTTVLPSTIFTLEDLAQRADYSLLNNLNADPEATENGLDFHPRQVFSGHYVPVRPTPIADPVYVAHSKLLFGELKMDDSLALTEAFKQFFSGNLNDGPSPLQPVGWATGYALSIFGNEYVQQCPFQTGNGYGDGRAISVLEVVIAGKRWEMQLKGAGRTPYCRGGDGRAVLRSSVREFLAQEHMHALGVPTSRSLCLYASASERVDRPWYVDGSKSLDPETMVSNPVAITTRVASSFLRVGQLELFARRARSNAHPHAQAELEMIILHAIEREYKDEIVGALPLREKVLQFACAFRERLTSLVTNWIRVGYCQGNFNSDNCAVGGFTLDYGPFGFIERFEPFYQPWTGGGRHFSFLNQPQAAEKNFESFCAALRPALDSDTDALSALETICAEFSAVMEEKLQHMWATKLGLVSYDAELVVQLLQLMINTSVDYTVLFRELSSLPGDIDAIYKSFYREPAEGLREEWQQWFRSWRSRLQSGKAVDEISRNMKQVNPKYTWREWLIVPAYQHAEHEDYSRIRQLQEVLTQPYEEQSDAIAERYYTLRPEAYFGRGGITHYSCSS
ncbi:protein adenylyltransferase SelO family protein [Alteromonas ponticola]|uniref:Protein nucleotidyltransferase YdiU n=1 Tax=Alteromonas aquimaris TaxID=2998417 RepID=A0ABT3P8V5_9ALTE|nr:protein adenylyltransferase SelO family protein [Alteromonas aquimaris]MCW8109188.1 protein adenylyltransferase SelO family protein [Alteromonas aquimaris]